MDIDFEQYNVGMPRGGTVVLADHDTRWTACFDVISGSMAAGLEPFEIEIHHVGSTAVPNIKAKPILDVLCIADVIEAFDALRHRMEEMDFVWKGEYGIPGRRYCVRYNREQTVSYVHLHAFRRGNPAAEEHLLFRDYLRARPEKAQQYESLKRTLAEKFASDRKELHGREGHADKNADPGSPNVEGRETKRQMRKKAHRYRQGPQLKSISVRRRRVAQPRVLHGEYAVRVNHRAPHHRAAQATAARSAPSRIS